MRYFEDTYLKRLTESEPFGGYKLKEETQEINLTTEAMKKTDKDGGGLGGILLIFSKGTLAKAFYIKGATATNYNRLGGGKTALLNTPPANGIELEKDIGYLYLKEHMTAAHSALESIGWTRDPRAMNSTEWHNAQTEVNTKYSKKGTGSVIAASIENSLQQRGDTSAWTGSVTKK